MQYFSKIINETKICSPKTKVFLGANNFHDDNILSFNF